MYSSDEFIFLYKELLLLFADDFAFAKETANNVLHQALIYFLCHRDQLKYYQLILDY